jgi:hypothetical protein
MRLNPVGAGAQLRCQNSDWNSKPAFREIVLVSNDMRFVLGNSGPIESIGYGEETNPAATQPRPGSISFRFGSAAVGHERTMPRHTDQVLGQGGPHRRVMAHRGSPMAPAWLSCGSPWLALWLVVAPGWLNAGPDRFCRSPASVRAMSTPRPCSSSRFDTS